MVQMIHEHSIHVLLAGPMRKQHRSTGECDFDSDKGHHFFFTEKTSAARLQ